MLDCSEIRWCKYNMCPILNMVNSLGIGNRFLEGIVFSMPFRWVRDLKSQDQLVDSKMMVEK